METLISNVLEEGQTLTVKHAAYKLGLDFPSAEAVLRERVEALKSQLLCSYIVATDSQVTLVVNPDTVPSASKLFSIQRKTVTLEEGTAALNNSLDSAREDLLKEEDSGFLKNARGVVQVEGLEVLPAGQSGMGAQRSNAPAQNISSNAAPKHTPSAAAPSSAPPKQKTAADFFKRAPAPASAPARTDEQPSKPPTSPKKPEVTATLASVISTNKSPQKKTEPAENDYSASRSVLSEKSPAKSANVERTTKSPAEKSEFDEEETSSSDDDSSESDVSSTSDQAGNGDGRATDLDAKTAKAVGSAKKAARKERRSKKRRVIEDDDEATEEKRKEREARKAQRKLERAAEREREKELKAKRLHEEKEEAKHEFLKNLGVTPSTAKSSVGKRKVLRTRTFIDEDGFEVTEDVMVEEDIPLDEIQPEPEAPKPKPVTPSTAPAPKEKKETATSSGPAKPAAPKQASLTSFFTKKSK